MAAAMAETRSTTPVDSNHVSVTRRDVDRLTPFWTHEGRSLTQANVYAYEIEGRRVAVKDFGCRPWPIRRWWGRWVLRREWNRLERLRDVAGIPQPIGWVDSDAFVMEWVDAERMPYLEENSLEPAFFDRLGELIANMHACGVAHGDLRRKNILVDGAQNPYLVDFATAFLAGPGRHRQRMFQRICRIDDLKVVKLKSDYCPDGLTDAERQLLARSDPLLLRIGHFFRNSVYRPFIKPKRWRRRWKRLRGAFSCRCGDGEKESERNSEEKNDRAD